MIFIRNVATPSRQQSSAVLGIRMFTPVLQPAAKVGRILGRAIPIQTEARPAARQIDSSMAIGLSITFDHQVNRCAPGASF